MNTTIAVAIISLIGVIISSYCTYKIAAKQSDKTMALMEYRLDALETKVDKHNNLVERTYHLETEIEVLKANHNT